MSAVVCIRCGIGAIPNLNSALAKVNLSRPGFRQEIRYQHRNVMVCNAVGQKRAELQAAQEREYRSIRGRLKRAWSRVKAVAA